jgi:hypothetical protein
LTEFYEFVYSSRESFEKRSKKEAWPLKIHWEFIGCWYQRGPARAFVRGGRAKRS